MSEVVALSVASRDRVASFRVPFLDFYSFHRIAGYTGTECEYECILHQVEKHRFCYSLKLPDIKVHTLKDQRNKKKPKMSSLRNATKEQVLVRL
jgi:hypothetical protein